MDLLADLRYAVRLLRKTPVFTVAAIGTLALGIGANTTIFSLVQTMLLRPLPYQNPDQVVMVWEDRTAAGFPRNTPAPANYRDWRAMNRSFTDMAATAFAFANLTGDGAPELVLGRRVTANFFSVLGVQPVARPRLHGGGRHQRSASRGDQPRALAAPLRRRSGHRRPHDFDEWPELRGAGGRRHARGGRCGPAVVRLPQPRDRLLGPDAVLARGGRHARQPLPERGRPPEARCVRRGCGLGHAGDCEAPQRAVSGDQSRSRRPWSSRSANRCSATPGSR